MNKISLQEIGGFLGLSGPAPSENVAFIAIDFENIYSIDPTHDRASLRSPNMQAGVAILDTNHLQSPPSFNRAISTYNFALGSSEYCGKVKTRFLFGKSTTISRQDLLQSLESLMPRSQSIVLVCHGRANEFRNLEKINFDFDTSILGVADTSLLYKSVKGASTGPPSLRTLLRTYKCPHTGLHCAGNDANFTLRLLLLLGVSYQNESRDENGRALLLKGIAYSPVSNRKPPYTTELERKWRSNYGT